MSEYRDLIPVIVEREQATMPDWCDSWGIKSVSPDLRTYGGYQWPYPGRAAKARKKDIVADNSDACPAQPGDGLCVATSWQGMASGGISARMLLLVAYHSGAVLGRDDGAGKLRTRRVYVAALVDGERLLREEGHGADLTRANLTRANLTRANLSGADLTGAALYGADLTGADLYGAALTGADLSGADLTGADLTRANLTRANLYGATLTGAALYGADLTGAALTGANLTGANLTGALMPSEWEADR